MIYLLDVNVMVALLDRRHSFSAAAHHWFSTTIGPGDGWATSAITENGCLRVGMSSRFADATPLLFKDLLMALNEICQLPSHRFWPEDRSIRTILPADVVLTKNQITDVYLLGLAMANNSKFATFDKKIPAFLLPGGPAALELIPATL